MLDIEIVTSPTATALDVVSRAEFKRHIRMSSSITAFDTEIDDILEEAFSDLNGLGGELNSTYVPTVYKRWMKKFPGNDENGDPLPILIPYGPLISLDAVTIEGDSPTLDVDASDYVVKSGMLVPEIHPVDTWPSVTEGPRAVSITYTAGYADDAYPPKFKRMLKILAAHNFENVEASIQEPRQMQINRKVEFGMDHLRNLLKIPNDYSDWNE